MALKKYNLLGAETGSVEVESALLEKRASPQLIKDYIVAIRHNLRQWSAKTQDRSEVKATKKKPHPQKGLGRARQGSYAAPQYKGGGVVFGPRPKFDQHVRINRKERRAAIRTLLCEKIDSGQLKILDDSLLTDIKTKPIASFLKAINLPKKRVLFIGAAQQSDHLHWQKSTKNLPKVQFSRLEHVNGYTLSVAQEIVVLDRAFEELLQVLGKKHEQ